MPLRFYNTMSKRKEVFRTLEKGKVKMYNCGPTVYDYAHIGNFRAYIFADLVRRYLEWKGFEVNQVMNITDVDDKTIKGSRKQGISLSEYTAKYTEAFFSDVKKLNIKQARIYPRATAHIKEMTEIVSALLKKGIAYKGDDGIYFSIKKFPGYGKLSGLDISNLKAGARVSQDEYDKESANDFVLWKFWNKDDGDVLWETPLGKGRPGWHIECSAMSRKHLGDTIDIHTGGVDLVFPHHENEIAQSEAFTGKPFVKHWMHNNHLIVEGSKMSKSLGNFFTLRDLFGKGHDPLSIRYLLLSAHYRAKLNLTEKGLKDAASTLERIFSFVRDMAAHTPMGTSVPKELVKATGTPKHKTDSILKEAMNGFEKAMDDDLGISDALASVFSMMTKVNKERDAGRLSQEDASKAYGFMIDIDRILGLNLKDLKTREDIPDEIKLLAKEREALRNKKDFSGADRLRDEIRKKGFVVEDTPEGPRIRKS